MKKIISRMTVVVLAVYMMIGCMAGAISALAESPYTYSYTHPANWAAFSTQEDLTQSLLYDPYGMNIVQHNLEDGTPFSTLWSSNPISAATDGTNTPAVLNVNVGSTLAYDMKSISNIDRFYMIGNGNYSISSYDLYIGNSLDTLYDQSNFILSGGNGVIDHVQHECYTFTGNKPQGRFLGIKITGISYRYSNNPYAAITEIAAYGSVATDSSYTYVNSQPSSFGSINEEWPSNLLYGISPRVRKQSGTSAKEVNSDTVISNATDGTTKPITVDAKQNGTLTFDLFRTCEFDRLYFITQANYSATSFEVFVSDKIETLYDDKNYVLTGHNFVSGASRHEKFVFNGKKPLGRYLGIRVTELGYTNKDNPYIGFTEIAAFGTPSEDTFYPYTMTTPDSYGTIGETWADSLLFGRNFSAKLANGANAEAIGDNVFVNAVDNNTQTVAAFNAGVGTTVTYDLHGTASIDKFYMIAKGNYVIKTYELYVSDKLDTLYNGENYLLTGGNNTSSGAIHNCFTFTGENKPEGRYIGVKILELGHPANYPDYASICETAIFGIKTIKTTNEELISAKTKILNADYTTDEKTYFDFNEDSEMDVCDLVLMNKALGN